MMGAACAFGGERGRDCGKFKSHCAVPGPVVEGPVFPRVVRERDFRLRELVPTPLNLRSLRRACAVSAFRFRSAFPV